MDQNLNNDLKVDENLKTEVDVKKEVEVEQFPVVMPTTNETKGDVQVTEKLEEEVEQLKKQVKQGQKLNGWGIAGLVFAIIGLIVSIISFPMVGTPPVFIVVIIVGFFFNAIGLILSIIGIVVAKKAGASVGIASLTTTGVAVCVSGCSCLCAIGIMCFILTLYGCVGLGLLIFFTVFFPMIV